MLLCLQSSISTLLITSSIYSSLKFYWLKSFIWIHTFLLNFSFLFFFFAGEDAPWANKLTSVADLPLFFFHVNHCHSTATNRWVVWFHNQELNPGPGRACWTFTTRPLRPAQFSLFFNNKSGTFLKWGNLESMDSCTNLEKIINYSSTTQQVVFASSLSQCIYSVVEFIKNIAFSIFFYLFSIVF